MWRAFSFRHPGHASDSERDAAAARHLEACRAK
jgi:hypothetical protein